MVEWARWMRFGDALVWRESVVTRNRRIALGRISALRISLATVLRQHGTFWASSSHVPWARRNDSRLAWWIVLIPCREVDPALLAVTGTAMPLSVVQPATRDLQRLAQGRHTVLPSILLDEGVLHFASRAK